MTLAGAPHVGYRGASLFIEDCELDGLARRFGTPLYVYSLTGMRESLNRYQQALAGRDSLVCYAMKANPALAVLQTFAQMGCGFDIVSGGELQRLLAIGADPAKVVFSGVGKTRAEMRLALDAGVLCFNVESEAELEVLSAVAQAAGHAARVSLRVNPDVDAGAHPYISTGLQASKFGIAHGRVLETYRRAARLPAIEVVGIDCHIGSQITRIGPYVDALDRVLDLVEAIESEGIGLSHIDLGGGLGITYTDESPPSAGALIAALLERIDSRGHHRLRLLLEPGRSLVGNAGVMLTEVLYLKDGRSPNDQSGARNFCIVDAAMNDLLRPAMYDAWMDIVPCERRGAAEVVRDVVGPVCESGDWLGRDRSLAVGAGDVLAVLSAGAYGMSMASNYNSRGRAAEVMVEGDKTWLIRDREAATDLFRGEHLIR